MKTKLELAGIVRRRRKQRCYVADEYMCKSGYYPVYRSHKVVRLIRKDTDRWEELELAPSYVCDYDYYQCYI